MAWHLAPSLARLRAEVNARWPGRDKASDGSIGDTAHQAGSSDHNPNGRGSVDAIDIDEDGVDMAAIIAAIQRHPAAHYWIYERVIADRDTGWQRRPYGGTNPHDKHLHVSIRQTVAAEQDDTPWGLEEDDVSWTDVLTNASGKKATAERVATDTADRVYEILKVAMPKLEGRLDAIETKVDQAPGTVVVTDEQLERVLRKVVGSVDGKS